MIPIVGNYRVPISQYLLPVRLLRQGKLYPSYFSNFKVCTTSIFRTSYHLLSRMIASSVSITALSSSNASMNLTISTGGVQISTVFKSSIGAVSIVDLTQNQTTLLTATYIPTTGPSIFALESLTISVPQNT